MRSFMYIWSGQLLSILGTAMTGFALGVWVFQQNGSATEFALINFCAQITGLIVTPFAGSVADRYSRRLVIIVSDTSAALATVLIVIFLMNGTLEIWHIYLTSALRAGSNAFQKPAYMAAVSLMVPKDQLARAAGLNQLSEALSRLLYPALGGFLLAWISLKGVIAVDLVTYVLAMIPLLLITIPEVPPAVKEKNATESSVWRDMGVGISYIRQRPGLMGLLLFALATNYLMGMVMALGLPLALSFTTVEVLGLILSAGALGMVISSLAVGITGGPKKLMHGVFGAQILLAISFLFLGYRADPVLIGAGAFLFFLGLPVTMACNQAIWQRKVEPEYQGRVLAMRTTIGGFTMPLAFLTGGPLADMVFEPLMVQGGALAELAGPYLGVGPGRGIGLLFIILGLLLIITTLIGLCISTLRNIETALPDWKAPSDSDQSTKEEQEK